MPGLNPVQYLEYYTPNDDYRDLHQRSLIILTEDSVLCYSSICYNKICGSLLPEINMDKWLSIMVMYSCPYV
jgi:hypothetical protein